jgi:DNA-binding MarR family transcriptional regulator
LLLHFIPNRLGRPAMSPAGLDGDRAPSTLTFLLSQVGAHVAQRFAQRIGELDLYPPQFRVMNAVDAAEGQSQQAIAEASGAPASRMVAIVDELEQRGLVERRPHPSDRRMRTLYLTGDGHELLGRGRKVALECEAEIAEGMSQADRDRLVRLLQKLVDAQDLGVGVHPGLRE